VPAPPPQAPSPVARTLHAAPAETVRAFGRASAAADRGLKVVATVFLEMRLGKGITSASVTPVIDSIIDSVQSNPFAFNGLMRFRRDSEAVYRHALATSALMIALGRSLALAPLELHAAGLAGLLLDAGISLLPAGDDDGPFDPARLPQDVWRSHVGLGEDFIRRSRLSDAIARACLEHHERHDGTGWPNGTAGTALSRLGRMAAICDAYDWLVSPADGRDGLDPAAAVQAMRGDAGAYDPAMLDAFATTLGVWPIGSMVELRSGRLAVVIDQHRDALDRPLVAVFFAPASGLPVQDVWIDLNTCYGADAIAGPVTLDTLPASQVAAATAALEAVIAQVAGNQPKKPVRSRKRKARAA
jgi:HD-GYP domain-containing protein (c-di-GMP phosphodiesterase class II)